MIIDSEFRLPAFSPETGPDNVEMLNKQLQPLFILSDKTAGT
jgi:hypothetical protein